MQSLHGLIDRYPNATKHDITEFLQLSRLLHSERKKNDAYLDQHHQCKVPVSAINAFIQSTSVRPLAAGSDIRLENVTTPLISVSY